MSKAPRRNSVNVLHNLSRISAALSVGKTFLADLPAGDQKTALASVFAEIETAEQTAFAFVRQIQTAADSI